MGYTVTAVLAVTARIDVSASDPQEAEIEAASRNVHDWEILDSFPGIDAIDAYEVVEVLESEPNGPDYEPDIMFYDVLN